MRRIAVGIAAAAALIATVGAVGPLSAGAAPGSTTVYTANAYSYGAGNIFGGTFCLDGELLSNPNTEQVDGPFTVASGSADVTFFSSNQDDCTGEPTASATVDLPSDGQVTLMAYWVPEGPAISMLPDPVTCLAAGMGRFTVRHGASVYTETETVDIWGTPPGGTDAVLLFPGVAAGGQATADLAVGTYTEVAAYEEGTPNLLVTLGDLTVSANQNLIEYLYGGNDGAVGSFEDTASLTACQVATTTTTTSTTTTTTAPPAGVSPAVEAAPAFTG